LSKAAIPKGTDLSGYSQTYLNKTARQLNERSRETLEYETPAERFNACVPSTGWAGTPITDIRRARCDVRLRKCIGSTGIADRDRRGEETGIGSITVR
jgi:hypothetical protein